MKLVLFLLVALGVATANAESSKTELYEGLSEGQILSIENEVEQMKFDIEGVVEIGGAAFTGKEWRPRRRGPRHRRRGPHYPRRGPHYPRRSPRGPFVKWQCHAENGRGYVFAGEDRDRYYAMREALSRCERRSRRCFRMGCRKVNRLPW